MSSPSTAAVARSIIYPGMDVHKDSITIAVLPAGRRRQTLSYEIAPAITHVTAGIS